MGRRGGCNGRPQLPYTIVLGTLVCSFAKKIQMHPHFVDNETEAYRG